MQAGLMEPPMQAMTFFMGKLIFWYTKTSSRAWKLGL